MMHSYLNGQEFYPSGFSKNWPILALYMLISTFEYVFDFVETHVSKVWIFWHRGINKFLKTWILFRYCIPFSLTDSPASGPHSRVHMYWIWGDEVGLIPEEKRGGGEISRRGPFKKKTVLCPVRTTSPSKILLTLWWQSNVLFSTKGNKWIKRLRKLFRFPAL